MTATHDPGRTRAIQLDALADRAHRLKGELTETRARGASYASELVKRYQRFGNELVREFGGEVTVHGRVKLQARCKHTPHVLEDIIDHNLMGRVATFSHDCEVMGYRRAVVVPMSYITDPDGWEALARLDVATQLELRDDEETQAEIEALTRRLAELTKQAEREGGHTS